MIEVEKCFRGEYVLIINIKTVKILKYEFIVPTFHNLYMKFTLGVDRYLKMKN